MCERIAISVAINSVNAIYVISTERKNIFIVVAFVSNIYDKKSQHSLHFPQKDRLVVGFLKAQMTSSHKACISNFLTHSLI